MTEAEVSEVVDPALEGSCAFVEERSPNSTKRPSATVVICAYSEKRWEQIEAAVRSVRRQTMPAAQCVLVVDHNEALLRRARDAFPDVNVIPNSETRGLSGGRNTGVREAVADVVVFLDDDAEADERWLEHLLSPYLERAVVGTGGEARARWPVARPSWFPPEFDWVVGCSYRGLPSRTSTVRNAIGANMSFRRDVMNRVGGFDHGIGRLGTLPLGCEETAFSIRLRRAVAGSRIVYVPEAVVLHHISDDRVRLKYFLRRCVAEGLSKATVARYVGQEAALESERQYVTRTLPRGVLRGLTSRGGQDYSPIKAVMIGVGLCTTLAGYLLGRTGLDGVAGWLLGRGRS